jgi:hypothetical protein
MQLVCQRNSLNRRSFTVQENAELSEILTVQKNAMGSGQFLRRNDSRGRKVGGLVLNAREPIQVQAGRLVREVHPESALVMPRLRDL